MTNREKYKEEICDIALADDCVAVNRKTLVPCYCSDTHCEDCIAHMLDDNFNSCNHHVIEEWANSEYVEPCPFEKDELVEVSETGKQWFLRYFSHQENGLYYCYDSGYTSQEINEVCPWAYCQKYGTLGGLVKEQNDDK